MTYDTIAAISQVASLLIFVAIFAGALAYALWPKNGPLFEEAQHRALDIGRNDLGERDGIRP